MTHDHRDWTYLCTEDGEPWAAFVEGHMDLSTFGVLDEQRIIELYGKFHLSDDVAEIVSEFGPAFKHFWVRREGELHCFAEEGEPESRPVTGLRFW